jgi:hypothetical protein
MNAKLKTKELTYQKDERPKMARIGDYWTEKQTTEIVDLQEYQDVFTCDYKYIKGLVEEMGEMKMTSS